MAATAPTRTDPYADDPRWSLVSTTPYPLLIDGELRQASDGATFDAVSPRDERVLAQVAQAGPSDVAAAVAAARRAVDEGPWGRSTGRERARALTAIADALEAHADELAFLEAVDSGKPISSVHYSDISISLDALGYFAGRAQAVTGRAASMPDASVLHHELLEPMGVVAEILPWNGPLWTGVQRMAAILAAGNAAIMKPAQMASLSFARLAQLMAELDLPPGAVNVLSGPGGVVGEALVTDPGVDLVSFTGGIEAGSRILELAAPTAKRISLEMGGKNPNIVCDDADLERAVWWSRLGAFGNTGQICVCGSRILVQRGIYDEFVERLGAAAGEMRVGDPLDPETELGPVVSTGHAGKVWSYIDIGRTEGRLVTGGVPYDEGHRSLKTYIPPTVFADTDPTCRIMREEIFGPVVALQAFDTLDDALAIANDTTYGLASGLFTSDLDRAAYLSQGLKAGQVYVNQWFSPGVLEAPSHGYRQSGYGGVGMEKYQQSKNVFTRVNPPA
ncbi:MAG TPA: aldehyde dehydrogenase family protein [Candidatus Limnocylindria bacterium]|nr:aldehyde dehydrogenase family protein [Candidatus Limnocylindria bacterium]